jgi:hypothetical protein
MEKSFKVTGKKLLKEAFLEDIKKLGYKPRGCATDKTITQGEDKHIVKPGRCRDIYEVNEGFIADTTYNLPEQYREALDAFRDAIQPVEEKKKSEELYTIVEFTPVEGCGLAAFYLRPNGKYSTRKDEDACLLRQDALMVSNDSVADGTYKITKIRRNSDGVEFGVGDKVLWDWVDAGDSKFFTIKEFYIGGGELKFSKKEGRGHTHPVNMLMGKSWNLRHYQEDQKKTEYVITAFKSKHHMVYSLRGNGEYSPAGYSTTHTAKQMLDSGDCVKSGHFRIERVKVQDTGIEYTIGDKIKTPGTHSNDVQVITEFVINEYGNCMVKTAQFSKHGIGIGKIVKVEPLFTTYDGVDVWDDCTLFWLVNKWDERSEKPGTTKTKGLWTWDKKSIDYTGTWKTFSTEAAMDKYLESIKPKVPVLVTEDGVEVFDKETICHVVFKDWAKEVVSSHYHKITKGKWFSTEAKADEYIRLHKPVFSYNDLAGIDNNQNLSNPIGMYILHEKIDKLIAEKLKSN